MDLQFMPTREALVGATVNVTSGKVGQATKGYLEKESSTKPLTVLARRHI